MDIIPKTTGKRRENLKMGIADGKPFSKDNQPSPELKKAGWEERKKERLFTSQVWAELVGETGLNLKEFTKKMIKLAEKGNPKAIEKVLAAIEDDSLKIDTSGELTIIIKRDGHV